MHAEENAKIVAYETRRLPSGIIQHTPLPNDLHICGCFCDHCAKVKLEYERQQALANQANINRLPPDTADVVREPYSGQLLRNEINLLKYQLENAMDWAKRQQSSIEQLENELASYRSQLIITRESAVKMARENEALKIELDEVKAERDRAKQAMISAANANIALHQKTIDLEKKAGVALQSIPLEEAIKIGRGHKVSRAIANIGESAIKMGLPLYDRF